MTQFQSQSIQSLIAILDQTITDACQLTAGARDAIQRSQLNEAIGTLLPLDDKLQAATALLHTILLLHRGRGGAA